MPVMLNTGPSGEGSEYFTNVAGVDGGSSYDIVSNTDNELYNSLANLFYNTNALDYERSLNLLDKENQFSATQAQINRDFQERMSNTAYQRQAEDLRLAGYNPALILGSGGSSTPSGSSASSSSVDLPNLLYSLSNAFTSIYTNAITAATTQRGQDISAAVTERGQNMKFASDLIRDVFSIIPKVGSSGK